MANMKLDRDAIVEAAFEVLEQEGLDGLSLRMVAGRLDAQAPALYWHVKNKAELLGLMAQTIGAAALEAESVAQQWDEQLIIYGHALRQAMLRHRDAARLCAVAEPLEDPKVNARRVAQPLIEAGLEVNRALTYQSGVIAYTLGWVIYEQSRAMHKHLAQMIDFDVSFDVGLRSMIFGFKNAGPPVAGKRRLRQVSQ